MRQPTVDQVLAIQQSTVSTAIGSYQRAVAKTIMDTAALAEDDVRTPTETATARVIAADTGSGKTSLTVSYIIARRLTDLSYTAAYVVKTIKEAHDIYSRLRKYLGSADVYVCTSAHEGHEYSTSEEVRRQVHQHIKDHEKSSRRDAAYYPIVVVTHELWKAEGEQGCDFGVRRFMKTHSRVNVFVDELPDAVSSIAVTPSDIMHFCEHIETVAAWRSAANVLRDVLGRMNRQFEQSGARFETCNFIHQEEYSIIAELELWQLRNKEVTA